MNSKCYSYEKIEHIVEKAKKGCKISTYTLIEILNPFMINLSKRVYVLNYSNEDLYQECIKNIFVSYATTSIKNNIYCIVRKRAKENFQTSLEKVEFSLNYDVDFHKNLDTFEKNELIKKLQLVFYKLKPEYREVLIHYYFKNKRLNDFKTNKDPYSLKRNAVKALKKELAKLNC